jgi:hypothetical protein
MAGGLMFQETGQAMMSLAIVRVDLWAERRGFLVVSSENYLSTKFSRQVRTLSVSHLVNAQASLCSLAFT